MTESAHIKTVRTSDLEIAYEDYGPVNGPAVLLMHGFPYDARAYDEVARELSSTGCRVIVPYLRGYGPTRFLSADTPRSGQQAALGLDLLHLMDALSLSHAVLAGYDWGGRAACIVAALWPERVAGLVSVCGYMVQEIARAATPLRPETEHLLWYQYYFHTPRGEAGFAKYRHEFCRLLWSLWSPTWSFDDATFARTAKSFDNPDFVEVVIHSYRHRFGYAPGDPKLDEIERQLARLPPISVPAIVLHGGDDGVVPPPVADTEAHRFTGKYRRQLIPGAGHNLPQETPDAIVTAVKELLAS